MEQLLRSLEHFIPRRLYKQLQPYYHFSLAFLSALVYRFPSRKLVVIGVTGTKGKSSTTELINCILEAAGHKTALSGTIRFKIAEKSRPNTYKMSMPGRFFMQKFLRDAVKAGCTHVVLEMTSEGARLFRHRFVQLDAVVFTNLSPEHIESHGSYEAYRDAKLDIAEQLWRGKKRRTVLVINEDDKEATYFAAKRATEVLPFRLADAEPYTIKPRGIDFTWDGQSFSSPLTGEFNLSNILAAVTVCSAFGVTDEALVKGVAECGDIKGRVERIDAGQPFDVIVDYAHTPESLTALYKAFSGKVIVGVLGNAGGGRDVWKRPEMASIAEHYCSHIILTNEDPYDEDPMSIIEDMRVAIARTEKPLEVILDRRHAIREALKVAYRTFSTTGAPVAVLISGKGTDPYIMGANNTKEPWSDAQVAREELDKLYARTA